MPNEAEKSKEPNIQEEGREVLGQVYLSGKGTPVGSFDFLVDRNTGTEVEIGTAVSTTSTEGVMTGTVVDMVSIGWAKDPFAVDLLGGQSVLDCRDEVMLASAQVLRSERLRPPKGGKINSATAQEMRAATGSANMEWEIPCGVLSLYDNSVVAVSLDGESLLGPDSAHCLIGGISGQAAKTSFAGCLLRSALSHGNPSTNSIAAVVFNVKGDDLIYLDQEPDPSMALTDKDKEIYHALGVSPTPFPEVKVYAPAVSLTGLANCAREDALVLRWTLQDVWPYLRYIWNFIGEDEKLSSFLSQFEDLKLRNSNPKFRIDSLTKMLGWMEVELREAETLGSQDCWGGRVHVATMRRMKRMFGGLSSRLGGLVPTGLSLEASDVPSEGWQHGSVVVVDVASLSPIVQGLVIARTVERLLSAAEDGRLGVEHLVVFADELNTFAPNQGGDFRAVKKILQRVITQGRYAGVSLWGAAQKLSKIDELVRDNAATVALGRCAASELDSGTYGRLPSGLTERLATLHRGEVAIWHYTLRTPLVVQFPRPAWKTGKSKSSRRKDGRGKLSGGGLSTEAIDNLSEGLSESQVESIVDSTTNMAEAVASLKEARVLDPKRVMLQPSEDSREKFDPDNPFNLE